MTEQRKSFAALGFGVTFCLAAVADDGILRLTRRRGGPGDAGPLGLGRSTPERLMIKATAPGHAVIRMYQARPWETRVAPRKSFAVNVQVSPS